MVCGSVGEGGSLCGLAKNVKPEGNVQVSGLVGGEIVGKGGVLAAGCHQQQPAGPALAWIDPHWPPIG